MWLLHKAASSLSLLGSPVQSTDALLCVVGEGGAGSLFLSGLEGQLMVGMETGVEGGKTSLPHAADAEQKAWKAPAVLSLEVGLACKCSVQPLAAKCSSQPRLQSKT